MRRFIALAVFALHGVALLLWLWDPSPPMTIEPQGPYFIGLWIPSAPPAVAVAELPVSVRKSRAPVPDEPNSRISGSLPTIAPGPAIAPGDSQNNETAQPQVDWAREAKLAAQEGSARNPPDGKDFSAPPKTIPPRCVPKKSSMEWNGKEDRRVGIDRGLPFVRLGRCIVGMGYFACSAADEVNGHLLDDMRDPERATSSVPDPNVCD